MAARLTQPVVKEAKHQVSRFFTALSLAAAGVACVTVGLAYFASSLWHALVPVLGTVGAVLIVCMIYPRTAT